MTALPKVSAGEEPLLALARTLFAQSGEGELRRLLEVPRKTPPRLSRSALGLLEESLSKGAVLFLARSGAARLVDGRRGWERVQPPPLRFTGASVRLLRWLLGLGEPPDLAVPLGRESFESGDEVLMVAALAATAGTAWQTVVAAQPLLRSSALCAAGFAYELGAAWPLDAVPALSLEPGGWQAFALDALADLFAQRWAEAELEKRLETQAARLRRAAQAQALVLAALVEASPDPAARAALGFLLEAGRTVLAAGSGPSAYGAALSHRGPVRDRFEAKVASAAFLRGLLALEAMDRQHREVRFTDDGYPAAQALVARWEALGPPRAQWPLVAQWVAALEAP